VVKKLREDAAFSTTPFVFLTAKSDKGDVRVGMNFGADDYLTKPVNREDLLTAVQICLQRSTMI
jgi:DNA-binding response OmpR family regulator